MAADTLPTISRILAVRDTRARIEDGDRWVPVPGSGNLRPCDRCGREHEVHVDVELSDGRVSNIGSGCAKGESMEMQGRLKSAVSAAKTRSKLRAALVSAREEFTAAEKAWTEVQKLAPPEPVLDEEIPEARGPRQIWRMGDVRVWTLPGHPFNRERRQALLSSWQSDHYKARGFERPPYSFRDQVKDLEKRLATIERKLKTLIF